MGTTLLNLMNGDSVCHCAGGACRGPVLLRDFESSVDRQHVAFAEQQIVIFADRDLVTGVRAEDYAVAGLESERIALAILRNMAVANRNHGSFLRLVLGRVGENDPPGEIGRASCRERV